MLLPPSPVSSYRGVDRNPFEPALLDNEIDPLANVQSDDSRIWVFYPKGWRRNAYRIFEENLVKSSEDELFFISNIEAAREIQRIIEPHLGPHEIVTCEIFELNSTQSLVDPIEILPHRGYDIAYLGGDLYSAILNGLLINPHPDLVAEYGPLLTEFGLFPSMDSISAYVRRFRELVPSEANSEFCLFQLTFE